MWYTKIKGEEVGRTMETSVTHSVYAADSEARYDALCKRLLSEK